MLWLALAIVALALLVAFLMSKSHEPPGPGYMRVVCVDQHGRETSREWVKIKEPDVYPDNGLSHVRPYVERLLASPAWFTTLALFTPDGERGMGMSKIDGGVSIDMMFHSEQDAAPEARARAFFDSRGYATKDDYLAGNGSVPDAARVLSWWVSGDAATVTTLCQTVLRDLCSIGDEEGLNITYEEREPR